MNRTLSRHLIRSLAGGVAVLFFYTLPARADWSEWWSTPEQQARAAFEAGDVDRLRSVAPDAIWQGIAQHKAEEFGAAAQSFADIAEQQQAAGNTEAANRALYNKGVSEVRAGQYEQAVQSFDQVLERAPGFEDAQHNRDIAQQLVQQQQQQQQQSQDGDGDDASSQDGEQQQSDPSGDEQSGEQQSSDQSESEEQAGEQSEESGEGSDDNSDASEAASEAQRQQDEQAARDALEAEAQAAEEEAANEDAQAAGDQQIEQPLTETEQATEQWLRRIPDDPAGLLRRKLEQSHRTDYPEVRDAREPW